MEELSSNASWERDLGSLQHLTQVLLDIMKVDNTDVLTSSDVLYLSQMMERGLTAVASTGTAGADVAEVMMSIATNYLKLASLMLEPHMAAHWIGLTDDGVRG